MSTNFKKAPLIEYSVHKIAEGEAGFNYYGYVHSSKGQVIIMREEIATQDILFADGGFNLTTAWAGRVDLTYKLKSEL